MRSIGNQVLLGYSATVSTVLAIVMLTGAGARDTSTFDRIRVHRLEVVEPNGTVRLVLANKKSLPPVIIKGKEHPEVGEARPQAGMIFYNDEGTENGGLIFSGHLSEKGEVVDSGGSFSFDRYGGNQIIQLVGVDDATDRFAGLAVSGKDHRRIWVGSDKDGTALMSLMDANGRNRNVMRVREDGNPSIEFLDEKGHVIRQISAEADKR